MNTNKQINITTFISQVYTALPTKEESWKEKKINILQLSISFWPTLSKVKDEELEQK